MSQVFTPAFEKTKPLGAAATRRVLVVVDDACTAPELCASVRGIAAGRPIEAVVVAPARGATIAEWYVDEDAARAEATHRLRTCLTCLARDGNHVRGFLGDPEPVRAVGDALHTFDADEIVLVTAPRGPSRWLLPSVVERIRMTFERPVRHVTMPAARRPG